MIPMDQFEIEEGENLLPERNDFIRSFIIDPISRTLSNACGRCRRISRRTRIYFSAHVEFRYALLSLLGILVAVFLYVILHAILSALMWRHSSQSFIDLTGYSIPTTQHGIVQNGSLDTCLVRCRAYEGCITVVYDRSHKPSCHFFHHTPFYLNFKPFPKNGSTIYVKNRELSEAQYRDGWYSYYLTSFASDLHELEYECQAFSDFFHLAVHTNASNARGAAQALYSYYIEPKDENSAVLLQEEYVVYPANPAFNVSHEVIDLRYVSVGKAVEVGVSPDTVGYGLCQGDPFNRAGRPAYYKDLFNLEEIMKTDEPNTMADRYVDTTQGNS